MQWILFPQKIAVLFLPIKGFYFYNFLKAVPILSIETLLGASDVPYIWSNYSDLTPINATWRSADPTPGLVFGLQQNGETKELLGATFGKLAASWSNWHVQNVRISAKFGGVLVFKLAERFGS